MIHAGRHPITSVVLLIGMPYSPWTERARWALDHHRLGYRFVDHAPILGELSLRMRTGRLTGRVTVPVLRTGVEVVTDSVDIVRYTDAHGHGDPLIPAELERDVLELVATSERILEAARGLVVQATVDCEEALIAATPPFLPAALRVPVGRLGTRLFAAKYGLSARSAEADRATIVAELEALRPRLLSGETLFGRLTLADIAVAGALQPVRAADDRLWRLTSAQRQVWQQPAIAERFEDLLAWRDRLYEKHR